MAKHSESFDRGKVEIVSIVSFLMGFSQAVVVYIISSYFKLISGTENIGWFYIISYGIVLLVLLNFHKAVRKVGKSQVFLMAVLAKIMAILLLIFLPPTPVSSVALILYLIFGGLEWAAIDIILESFSKDELSGRIRGIHWTVLNSSLS